MFDNHGALITEPTKERPVALRSKMVPGATVFVSKHYADALVERRHLPVVLPYRGIVSEAGTMKAIASFDRPDILSAIESVRPHDAYDIEVIDLTRYVSVLGHPTVWHKWKGLDAIGVVNP